MSHINVTINGRQYRFLFGDVPRKMNGKPWISWNTIVFILWLVMVWRLRKRHDFMTPPIV